MATENNTVDALSATSGKIMWSTHVATPVPASSLPCGDITPTVGITSTPVVDLSRHEVFVVADEETSAGPLHELVGLSLATGAVMLTQNVNPPGADASDILQRSALTLDDGRVIFGYGGNYGLCTYANPWLALLGSRDGRNSHVLRVRRPGRELSQWSVDGRFRAGHRCPGQLLDRRRQQLGHLGGVRRE